MSTRPGPVEIADDARGWGSFPRAWGLPPGDAYSETRAAWVRDKVRQHQVSAPLRRLAARDRRLLWTLRLAEIERKRPTP